MRYVGGKARIASWVADAVLALKGGRTDYLEPFVGSGAVFAKLAPKFERATAADAHIDLIMMWQALAAGSVPPESVSKDEYLALKRAAPSALRGFVGFGASFGGKWFGGYVDTAWDAHWNRYTKPYLAAARKSVIRDAEAFKRATIVCADYRVHEVGPNHLVYCDPPYADTLGYGGAGPFDSVEFWATATRWAERGALVVVSEAKAPQGWKLHATRERKAMLRVAVGGENESRVESLFTMGSGLGA